MKIVTLINCSHVFARKVSSAAEEHATSCRLASKIVRLVNFPRQVAPSAGTVSLVVLTLLKRLLTQK